MSTRKAAARPDASTAPEPPAAPPKEPRRKRLAVTSEEIAHVAGGYWSALDAMARAARSEDGQPDDGGLPPAAKRR